MKYMDVWRLVADRKIVEAMEEGAFDHLEGAGLPLDLREDPFEPRELRMAHRLLKNNGFAPAWIQERRDLETDIRSFRLRRAGAGPESAGELCREAADLNRRIAAYNLKAPSSLLHLAPVDAESAC